jgi:hypothetical protein
MSTTRKKALERLEGLAPRVEEHLAKIAAAPDSDAVSHWKTEIRNWLAQMQIATEHVGKKTGGLWAERIARFRSELEDT